MFTNKSDKKINEVSTVIGEATTVEGRFQVKSSIRVDGKIFGELKCDGDVTIGKEGYVEKGIISRNLYIAGTVKGNVKVQNKVHILESGHLDGAVEMKSIIIDENGHFHGRSIMKNNIDKITAMKSKKNNIVEIEKSISDKESDTATEKEKDNNLVDQHQ
ncbi:bactofilin family protein [Evansella cellulosilytica]|nr:polymer-forming cytoskeletal protein [Evansella cellulosilytica]